MGASADAQTSADVNLLLLAAGFCTQIPLGCYLFYFICTLTYSDNKKKCGPPISDLKNFLSKLCVFFVFVHVVFWCLWCLCMLFFGVCGVAACCFLVFVAFFARAFLIHTHTRQKEVNVVLLFFLYFVYGIYGK